MEEAIALAAEHAAFAERLDRFGPDDGDQPSACAGWSVRDVVLHLAQSDELAVAALAGAYPAAVARLTAGLAPAASVDDAAAAMVGADSSGWPEVKRRWAQTAAELRSGAARSEPSARVTWVTGTLSVRTLLATRLAETWIHGGDVAAALGEPPTASDRLRLVARLAWRTLPYAFSSAGAALHGPVAFELTGPDGTSWSFAGDEPAATTVSGPAADLCSVAARRLDPGRSALTADGPDGEAVLRLVRTYA